MTKRIASERSPGGDITNELEKPATEQRERKERSVTVECENPERAWVRGDREQRALRDDTDAREESVHRAEARDGVGLA